MTSLAASIAAEVRAGMARKRYTIGDLGDVLGISYKPAQQRYAGDVEFGIHDLSLVSSWLGTSVTTLFRDAEARLPEEVAA